MKKTLSPFIILFFCLQLFSFEIPYSQAPILSDQNMITDFIRIQPDDKASPPLNTKVWIWYDENDIFFHWECDIDQSFVKGQYRRKDQSGNADYVRVQVITNPEALYSYMFWGYPENGLSDGIRNPDLNLSMDWESHYDYQSIIENNKWIVKMRVPFEDLRFSGKPPYKWKINLQRMFLESDDIYNFPYTTTEMKKDYFANSYSIELTQPIKKSKIYTLKPYYVQGADFQKGNLSEIKDNIGTDLMLMPMNNINMKLTYNPDFSDVPIDGEQDTYTSKTPVYYSESRYFFTEDVDFFKMPIYTRNINKPIYGFKMTGVANNYNFGMMTLKDDQLVVDSDTLFYDDQYTFLGLRYQNNQLMNHYTLAFRNNKGYYNTVFFNATSWELNKDNRIYLEMENSLKEFRNSPDSENGFKLYGQYNFTFKDFFAECNETIKSKNYSNDFYLFTEPDGLHSNINFGIGKDDPAYGLEAFNINFSCNYNSELSSKNMLYVGRYLNSWIKPKEYYSFNINLTDEIEIYNQKKYSNKGIYTNLSFFNNKDYNVSLSYQISKPIVYYVNEHYQRSKFYLNLWYQLNENVSLNGNYNYTLWDYDLSFLDNEYSYLDGSVSITLLKVLQMNCGVNVNDQMRWLQMNPDIKKDLSFGGYLNLKIDLNRNVKIYSGFQYSQSEINEKYINQGNTGYFKITAEI